MLAFRFLTRSGSDYTSVSRTGFFPFFFKVVFDQDVNGHGLTDRVFFNLFFDLDVSVHAMDPVCETGVWSLTSHSKLSKRKTRSDRQWYG